MEAWKLVALFIIAWAAICVVYGVCWAIDVRRMMPKHYTTIKKGERTDEGTDSGRR